VFQSKLFFCFVIFSFDVFCFASDDNVFYESENDRVLQLIENERMEEELYAKKQAEKKLKKLKKLEEKEKKRLMKSKNRSNSNDDFYSNNLKEEVSINSNNLENFDVLSFDYVKNKQKNSKESVNTENIKTGKEDNVASFALDSKDNNSNKDISYKKAEHKEKFKNFEIVTKVSSDDKSGEVIVLKDPSVDKLEKKLVKRPKNGINKGRLKNKYKKSNALRKQKFEFNKNIKPVYFNNDSSYIASEYRKILDSNILWLKRNPMYKILIIGHTDKLGKMEYNIKLGQDRANAVKKYFIQSGIYGSRIQTISYGFFKSKFLSNKVDRKVEILIYK